MIVHINRDWRIATDPHQWLVQKRRAVNGQDKWGSLTYHKTLDKACLSLAQRQLRDLDTDYWCEELIGFCRAVDSLKSEIRAALRTVKTEAEAWEDLRASGANDGR